MTKTVHRAGDRGKGDFGWLKANYSFSFSRYHDPEKTHFGALRVLNDDQVAPGAGFSMHPHADMEIITIPLEGELVHKDNMGHTAVLHPGKIQVMSAGTGVMHSEFNNSDENYLKLLQLWIIPELRGVEPRYDELTFDRSELLNNWHTLVTPKDHSLNGSSWIYQNAWIHLGHWDAGYSREYELHGTGQGAYLFVIDGIVEVAGETLEKRDAMGVSEKDILPITATEDAELLLIEVPLIK